MSTTTESQPQRAMLSAEAELGMPSQPLTATPPFFQRVLSLFSRKAVSPVGLCFRPTMDMAALRGQSGVARRRHARDYPRCMAHDLVGEPVSTSPDNALPPFPAPGGAFSAE